MKSSSSVALKGTQDRKKREGHGIFHSQFLIHSVSMANFKKNKHFKMSFTNR